MHWSNFFFLSSLWLSLTSRGCVHSTSTVIHCIKAVNPPQKVVFANFCFHVSGYVFHFAVFVSCFDTTGLGFCHDFFFFFFFFFWDYFSRSDHDTYQLRLLDKTLILTFSGRWIYSRDFGAKGNRMINTWLWENGWEMGTAARVQILDETAFYNM